MVGNRKMCQRPPVEVDVRTGCRINDAIHHTARDLTDDQWRVLDPLIPEPKPRNDGRGRPWKSRRSVLNGTLWVLRSGAPWADLPDAYPSFQTCHRRFQQRVDRGVVKTYFLKIDCDTAWGRAQEMVQRSPHVRLLCFRRAEPLVSSGNSVPGCSSSG